MTVLLVDGAVTTACRLSAPGHTPHIIQARRALGAVPVPLTVLAVTERGIVVTDGEGSTEWLMHDAARAIVRASLDLGVRTLDDYGTSFAVIGATAISYSDAAEWTECRDDDPVNTGGPVAHFTVDR